MGLFDNWDGSDYGALISAIVGAYGATRNKSFHIAPESPETTAIRKRMYGFIDNSPTRNMLGQMLGDYMKSDQASPYQPPPPTYGYNPYPKGDSSPTFDLTKLLPMLGGSSGSPQPTTTGGTDGGGSPVTQPGGASGIPNMPQGLSSGDQGAFMDFVRTYGKGAAESLIGIISANPMVGIKGAIDLYRAYTSGGQTPQTLPTKGALPYPDILTPGAKPSLDTPYNDWFNQPSNTVQQNPNYQQQQGDKSMDNASAGSIISQLLGMQQGGGDDGKGPKAF